MFVSANRRRAQAQLLKGQKNSSVCLIQWRWSTKIMWPLTIIRHHSFTCIWRFTYVCHHLYTSGLLASQRVGRQKVSLFPLTIWSTCFWWLCFIEFICLTWNGLLHSHWKIILLSCFFFYMINSFICLKLQGIFLYLSHFVINNYKM